MEKKYPKMVRGEIGALYLENIYLVFAAIIFLVSMKPQEPEQLK